MLGLLLTPMNATDIANWLQTSLAPLDCTGQGVLDGTQLRVMVEGKGVPSATQVMNCLRSGLPKNVGLKPRPNASGTATPRGRLYAILKIEARVVNLSKNPVA
jgi:hypothetical protein